MGPRGAGKHDAALGAPAAARGHVRSPPSAPIGLAASLFAPLACPHSLTPRAFSAFRPALACHFQPMSTVSCRSPVWLVV
jgi:hypothetical protein